MNYPLARIVCMVNNTHASAVIAKEKELMTIVANPQPGQSTVTLEAPGVKRFEVLAGTELEHIRLLIENGSTHITAIKWSHQANMPGAEPPVRSYSIAMDHYDTDGAGIIRTPVNIHG